MSFLIQKTLLYAVPLMVVALAGVFAERSGVINLALEGIMIFGAFIGVLFVRIAQNLGWFADTTNLLLMQSFSSLAMIIAGIFGLLFALLLAFASINMKADQTISGTALNLLAPALVLFLVQLIAQQSVLYVPDSSCFVMKFSHFGLSKKTAGFMATTFLNKMYFPTYLCILAYIALSIFLYKTRFGLRLRSCGENPQASASLGIDVIKMRYAGVMFSGFLAGMGGFLYALTVTSCSANGEVAGLGFLALAVMIFGNWKPLNIAGGAILFGLFKCIAASYDTLDINGDGIMWLRDLGISSHFYRLLPYLITLLVLAFTSKSSRCPKAEGIPYDPTRR